MSNIMKSYQILLPKLYPQDGKNKLFDYLIQSIQLIEYIERKNPLNTIYLALEVLQIISFKLLKENHEVVDHYVRRFILYLKPEAYDPKLVSRMLKPLVKVQNILSPGNVTSAFKIFYLNLIKVSFRQGKTKGYLLLLQFCKNLKVQVQ